jgi:sigma-B regulation protein RsbU (phosphoserine phosphatase)
MTWIYYLVIAVAFLYVFIQLVSPRKPFQNLLDNTASWKEKAVIILLFGGLSMLGTYIGTELPSGANFRDIGPIIAGLAGGPVVGVITGLIGGIYRYTMGGFTAVPCALATIFIGLFCGLIYLKNGKRLIKIPQAVLVVVIMELFHFALTLAIARPFDDALNVVKTVFIPMIVANSVGVAVALQAIKDRYYEVIPPKDIKL